MFHLCRRPSTRLFNEDLRCERARGLHGEIQLATVVLSKDLTKEFLDSAPTLSYGSVICNPLRVICEHRGERFGLAIVIGVDKAARELHDGPLLRRELVCYLLSMGEQEGAS